MVGCGVFARAVSKLPGVGCKIRVWRETEGADGGLFDSSKRFCRMSLKGRRRIFGEV